MSRLRENVACANGEGRLAQRAGLHDNNLDTVGEPEWALIYGKIEHDFIFFSTPSLWEHGEKTRERPRYSMEAAVDARTATLGRRRQCGGR